MTGGTLAAKQVELLKESFPDLPRLTVLGDSLSTAQLVGAEHATGWLGRQDFEPGNGGIKIRLFRVFGQCSF